jgi:hypothetical protein
MMQSETYHKQPGVRNVGYYSALCTVVLTAITFAIAFLTPPLSGPWCKGGCFDYPYLDISTRFPRDYFWMYPSMLLSIVFVVLMASIHQQTIETRKVYSLTAFGFSLISSTILFIDYFIQVSVIQPGLLKGETDGISILTQYNPHGVFIALEEIGYLVMSLAFFCIRSAFPKSNRLTKVLRTTYLISFLLMLLAFIVIGVLYGVDRAYRFEVAVITINWITLILSGIMLVRFFKPLKSHQPASL